MGDVRRPPVEWNTLRGEWRRLEGRRDESCLEVEGVDADGRDLDSDEGREQDEEGGDRLDPRGEDVDG